MGAVVNHTHDGEKERRHYAVREHLQARAAHAGGVHGGKAHCHQAHVADAGKANDVLEILLHHGDERAVNHIDRHQKDDQG